MIRAVQCVRENPGLNVQDAYVCVVDGWGFSYFQSGASPTGLKYQVIGGVHAVQYMRGKW